MPHDPNPLIAINARHLHALRSCQYHLDAAASGFAAHTAPEFLAVDLRSALFDLDAVLGKTGVEDILDEIFRSFCIGK